jgi:hypothetical protein
MVIKLLEELNQPLAGIFGHVRQSVDGQEKRGIRGKQAGHQGRKLFIREIEDVIQGNPRKGPQGEGEIAAYGLVSTLSGQFHLAALRLATRPA